MRKKRKKIKKRMGGKKVKKRKTGDVFYGEDVEICEVEVFFIFFSFVRKVY